MFICCLIYPRCQDEEIISVLHFTCQRSQCYGRSVCYWPTNSLTADLCTAVSLQRLNTLQCFILTGNGASVRVQNKECLVWAWYFSDWLFFLSDFIKEQTRETCSPWFKLLVTLKHQQWVCRCVWHECGTTMRIQGLSFTILWYCKRGNILELKTILNHHLCIKSH